VSTPPFLAPPEGTVVAPVDTPRGPLAAWVLHAGASHRGTAVLVPGFTGSKEDFVAVLGPLAADGWTVVAYDHRGQGQSPHTATVESYGLAALADDLLALIAAVSAGPVHLVGHSFGGLVAQNALVRAAGTPVAASLTLLCSGPSGFSVCDPGAPSDLPVFIQGAGLLDGEGLWNAVRAHQGQDSPQPADPAVAAFVHDRFVAADVLSHRAIAEALYAAADVVDAVAALELPALVAYGESDDAWPQPVQDLTAERLHAKRLIMPGAGHSPSAETPRETARMLSDFWATAQVQ
jgi:pimeloyl-ACP methyl ester carboxylesterase